MNVDGYHRNKKKREFETVLPLVNIVFLLLIFFMLAGAFTKPDMFNVVVPEASVDENTNRNDITVLMSADNEFAIDTTRHSKDELIAMIESQLTDKKIIVQLKADARVKSQDLIEIMEALSATGLESIQLLTVTSNDSEALQKP